jgi:hypothetical protein
MTNDPPQATSPVNRQKLTSVAETKSMRTLNWSKTSMFELGETRATPGALEALDDSGQAASFFLDRHARGDWGEVSQNDWQFNDQALQDGSRLLSAYKTLKGVKLWVITEAVDDAGRRQGTTILLPFEY